jgi:hypothetical protein
LKCYEIKQFINKGSLHEEFMAQLHFIDLEETEYIIHNIFLQYQNSQV